MVLSQLEDELLILPQDCERYALVHYMVEQKCTVSCRKPMGSLCLLLESGKQLDGGFTSRSEGYELRKRHVSSNQHDRRSGACVLPDCIHLLCSGRSMGMP